MIELHWSTLVCMVALLAYLALMMHLGRMRDDDKGEAEPKKVVLKNGLIASLDDIKIKNNRVTYRLLRLLSSLKEEGNLSEQTKYEVKKCKEALDDLLDE